MKAYIVKTRNQMKIFGIIAPILSLSLSIMIALQVGMGGIWDNEVFKTLVLIGISAFLISRIVIFVLGLFIH